MQGSQASRIEPCRLTVHLQPVESAVHSCSVGGHAGVGAAVRHLAAGVRAAVRELRAGDLQTASSRGDEHFQRLRVPMGRPSFSQERLGGGIPAASQARVTGLPAVPSTLSSAGPSILGGTGEGGRRFEYHIISSVWRSFRMRSLADSVAARPFLYQVTVGGGTAADSHSRVTDSPTSTFTTTGESPPPPARMLGGTERRGARGRRIWSVRPPEGTAGNIQSCCCFHCSLTSQCPLCSQCQIVSISSGTWHDERVGVGLNGAAVVQPAHGGRRETGGFTGERHRAVHQHAHALRTPAHDGGRHWERKTREQFCIFEVKSDIYTGERLYMWPQLMNHMRLTVNIECPPIGQEPVGPIGDHWLAVLKPGDLGGGASVHLALQLGSSVHQDRDLVWGIPAGSPYGRGY
ncbi:hypothetical protein EYF80_033235 [Liparis tanakae]|uniref:Uncharacterized protein n=1 Tax=Liparis tanakae TaxID=230148 RepID=A0A4Z2GSZ4_9TELE|nr:hypothetical protein EYF80_033235 [Liparis tanakae]